jgi:flavin-dependent dehydrogenase
LNTPAGEYDVILTGGGLAGLSCALHLRLRNPRARILVLERREGLSPEGTHTVGESTVEIGANYFSEVLGEGEHLRTRHLRKFGFRFFHLDGRQDIAAVQEIGVSHYLQVTSFQIDRGIFENHLRERARAAGIEVCTGWRVEGYELAGSQGRAVTPHRVRVRRGERTLQVAGRWVVDASGRCGLLKRQLDLGAHSPHDAHAAWFRVPMLIDIEDWSRDPEWLGRCEPGQRWRSTNHLMGAGYWVWMIPLSSGHHSIGIVADPRLHPPALLNSYPRALAWLEQHQPRLARALRDAGAAPADFVALRRFSYDCRELFSADRWAMTGEAGVFLDPFYSPGSDFIAIANTYVVDLVTRDLAGEPWQPYVAVYGQLFRSFYESTMQLYQGQYALFGDPQVLATKVIWDYAFYWGVLCQLFFQDKLTDIPALGRAREPLASAKHMNEAMQPWLRRWAASRSACHAPGMLDQAGLPWFAALNRSLGDRLDAAGFQARLRDSRAQLEQLAAEVVGRALRELPGAAHWPETHALLACAGRGPDPHGTMLDYPPATRQVSPTA